MKQIGRGCEIEIQKVRQSVFTQKTNNWITRPVFQL